MLNLKGHQNCVIHSKITVILLNGGFCLLVGRPSKSEFSCAQRSKFCTDFSKILRSRATSRLQLLEALLVELNWEWSVLSVTHQTCFLTNAHMNSHSIKYLKEILSLQPTETLFGILSILAQLLDILLRLNTSQLYPCMYRCSESVLLKQFL